MQTACLKKPRTPKPSFSHAYGNKRFAIAKPSIRNLPDGRVAVDWRGRQHSRTAPVSLEGTPEELLAHYEQLIQLIRPLSTPATSA